MKLDSLFAVRTRLELATPGVTGRYSKPTELPHHGFKELATSSWNGDAKLLTFFILPNFFLKTLQQKKLGILKQMADLRGAAGKI